MTSTSTTPMLASASDRSSSLKKLAVHGAFWTIGGYGWSQMMRLGNHLILAYLLAPEIFGLMALVKVVMHGLEMFSDVGIKPSIIQNKRGADPAFLNTAWTIQVGRGFTLWLAACALAWPMAVFFGQNDPAATQLVYLLPVAAFSAVVAGFGSTTLATLNRDLRFGRLTSLEVVTQLVSLSVMVIWAWFHPSVWAMIAGGLAAGLFKTVVSHVLVPGHKVWFQWDRESVGELIKFGKWIFLSTVFTFLALNLDRIVLGKLLTLAELGLYSIAFVFAKVPFYISTRLGGTVLFPVYSKFRDDPNRMVSVALRAREPVLWLGAGICVAMAIGARLFFETLWPEKYLGIGQIAQCMPLYIWMMILLLSMDRIPLALGNSKVLFYSNVLRCLGIAFAIAGYSLGGLTGFIVGMAFGPLISHLYVLLYVPVQRAAIGRQGIRFTVLGAAYGVPATLFTEWLYLKLDYWTWGGCVIALAALPLSIACLFVLSHLRSNNSEPRPSSAPTA